MLLVILWNKFFVIVYKASIADHTASNGSMIYECEFYRIWKETVVVFKGHNINIYMEEPRKTTKRVTIRRRLETRISRVQVQGVSATQTRSVLRHNKVKHPPKFSAVDDVRHVPHSGVDYMNTRFFSIVHFFPGITLYYFSLFILFVLCQWNCERACPCSRSPLVYRCHNFLLPQVWKLNCKRFIINPYPTAFPYGNGMVLHFYQQQESSTTKTVHKVINKGLKAYV